MKRRDFILLSGGTLAVAGISWAVWPKSEYAITRGLPPLVLSQLCDEQELVKIGEGYRHQMPGEDDMSVLNDHLKINETGKAELQDSRQLAIALEERSRNEFESGKTIVIDGWVLSLTEARQCAAYSITHSR
jgi:hypothetical protein